MRTKYVAASLALLFTMPALACGSAPGSGSDPINGTTQENLDVVHQTVVRANADGTLNVTYVDVPIAQVETMLAQRIQARQALQNHSLASATVGQPTVVGGEHIGMSASAISSPTGNGAYLASGCGDNDLWLFSTTNNCATIPRGTYQLCYNAGSDPCTAAFLSSVTYPGPPTGDTWYQHVVTYSPGSQSGALDWDVPGDDGCWQSWGQNEYFGCYNASSTYDTDCTGYVGTNEAYL